MSVRSCRVLGLVLLLPFLMLQGCPRSEAGAQQTSPVVITLETDEPAETKPQGEQTRKEAESPKAGAERDLTMIGMWKDGPLLATRSGDFQAAFHGRFDVDGAWFVAGERLQTGPGGVGELRDGADFRRARLRVDGVAYEVFRWVAEFDFAMAQEGEARQVGITDVYWDTTQMPVVGNFRVGHMREPFSMEALTSGIALPFLERSAAFEAFCPFRNLGAMIFNTALNDRMTWAVGAFRTNSRNTGNPSDFGDGEFAGTGRVTFLPICDEAGFYLVHVGAGYTHRGFNLDNDPVRLRTFPSVRTGRYIFADTGPLFADRLDVANLEFAAKFGPFVLQSEYYHAWVTDAIIDDVARHPSFHGWYIQATWLLTGEEHPYRRTLPTTNPAVFDRPRPFENFVFVKTGGEGPWWRRFIFGSGAWELAARYCCLDLNDPGQGVNGQTYQDLTLGLNWYLTINTKIQGNYILADRNNPSQDNSGVAHIFAVRFHHDF